MAEIVTIGEATLYLGDCMDILPTLPKVDAVITDPPYGTTQCKWDVVIPFDEMWSKLKLICNHNAAIVLFGSEPFSSHLRLSNLKNYKHDWVWKKSIPKGHLNSKKYPLRIHELIHIFSFDTPKYIPQMFQSKPMNSVYKSGGNGKDSTYNKMKTVASKEVNRTERFPQDVIEFSELPGNAKERVHSTQKPVSLLEYFIKTYSNKNEIVLDFTMGSGTTGVACMNTNRKFIGIEKDKKYFDIACERINKAKENQGMFA
jgi:site-specific DNA-methyltransferase (adenine-specific)